MSNDEPSPHDPPSAPRRHRPRSTAARAPTRWRSAAREFVLIVAGVMAALAGQSWWENRQERSLERKYLESLAADLRANLAEFDHANRRNANNDGAALTLLAALDPALPPPAPDSLAGAIERAGYLYLAVVGSYTFDELRSTGGLQLLRSFPLKRQIAEYNSLVHGFSQWDEGYQVERLRYREMTRGILSSEVRARARRMEPLGLPAAEGDRMLRRLRAEPGLRDQVQELMYIRQRKRQDYGDLEKRARALLLRLEQESPSRRVRGGSVPGRRRAAAPRADRPGAWPAGITARRRRGAARP